MTTYHISGRQTGKTTRLLEWLRLYPNGVILVPTHQQKTFVEMQIREHLGRNLPDNVWTWDSWVKRGPQGEQRPIAVDNLDSMLTKIFGGQVHQVTATGEVYK